MYILKCKWSFFEKGGVILDIKRMIAEYAEWIKNEITFERVGEYYEITTPYLDNANDYIQIYVKQQDGTIYFTDDGVTIQNLKMMGLTFTPTRNEHLSRILMQYGVKLNGNEIISRAEPDDFPQKKHMFMQALLRVDDMFSMTKPKVSSFFLDDIQDYFDKHEIFCADNIQITGKSGMTHSYDYLIQRSRSKPERLCRAVNMPNKVNMTNVLFSWNDTMAVRRPDSKLIVILNDNNKIGGGVIEGFQNYEAQVIKWSEREKQNNIELLTA